VILGAARHVYRAMQYHAYPDVDALIDGFILKSMEYAMYMVDFPVLVASLFGGLLAGVFSGFAGRLWS